MIFKNNIAYNENYLALGVESKSYEVIVGHNNWHVSEEWDYAVDLAGEIYSRANINELKNHNIFAVPEFVDAGLQPDVHLVNGSKMIDAGTQIEINSKTEEFFGLAPDLGCFEKSAY